MSPTNARAINRKRPGLWMDPAGRVRCGLHLPAHAKPAPAWKPGQGDAQGWAYLSPAMLRGFVAGKGCEICGCEVTRLRPRGAA